MRFKKKFSGSRISRSSVIELSVPVFIGIVFAIVMLSFILRFYGGNHENVEQDARAWAEGMGMKVKGVNCVRVDSDGDGYISCAVRTEEEGVQALECAWLFSLNSGCRLAKARAIF